MSGETARDVTVLKNKYNNLKKRAKGNFAQERSNAFGTGGVPSDPSPVTELDIQIKEIIGKQVTGDDSIFDSDAMDDHPTRENDIEIVGTEVVDETITIEINDSDGKNDKAHIQAIVKEKTFAKVIIEHSLDNQLRISHEQHNQEVRKNREILKRLIDVVCFLGEHELAFRDHIESESSSNKGNYVDLLNLLAKYDEPLKFHLDNSKVFKGTSNLIQNDLIASRGEVALKRIKTEIKDASFVAIMVDETTDIANETKERFLGFVNISLERTASSLYNLVQKTIEELECGSKLIAQSYDGAAVMAGELGGLQAKSSKRSSALDSEVHKRMPKVAPTRWNYNGRLVQTIYEYRQPLIELFELFLNQEERWNHETVVCSRGYLSLLTKDKIFNLLLISFSDIHCVSYKMHHLEGITPIERGRMIGMHEASLPFREITRRLGPTDSTILRTSREWNNEELQMRRRGTSLGLVCGTLMDAYVFEGLEAKGGAFYLKRSVFPFCDNVFAVLQNKTSDIKFCIKNINEFKSIISSKREKFDEIWNKFHMFDIGTEPDMKRSRIAVIGACFQRLYFEIIDNITSHMDTRFQNFSNLEFLELVDFNSHTVVSESALECLKRKYSVYFDFHSLRSELFVMYNTEGLNKNTLTIPATSVSTERSFSALKRIKTFMRNSTRQERFSHLALLSIEKELIQEMALQQHFYDEVIDEFAKKTRRIPLSFK
ncbi:uncharacterized protein LOC135129937 [Zophobas morio]|uniref:uncharacterized protein LOC135129937 n=1 Tax=Zophobas morio TaxID=2755281 RepID=UPI0030831605